MQKVRELATLRNISKLPHYHSASCGISVLEHSVFTCFTGRLRVYWEKHRSVEPLLDTHRPDREKVAPFTDVTIDTLFG